MTMLGQGRTTPNEEKWRHKYHWEQREVTIAVVGAPGAQNLGGPVGAGLRRRIRRLKLRNTGTNPTVVSLLVGATVVDSWGVPAGNDSAGCTRIVEDEDGWAFAVGEQPIVQTSDITGGLTYVSARGVEAAPT